MNVKDELLKKILDSFTVKGNSIVRGLPQGFGFERNRAVLISELMSDDNIKKRLNDMKYYCNSDDGIFGGDEVDKVLKKMKVKGEYEYKKFLNQLGDNLDKIKRDKIISNYDLYFPINMKSEKDLEPIKFKDVVINIVNYEAIKRLFKVRKHSNLSRDVNFMRNKNSYMYIHVPIKARNIIYARDIATQYIRLVLGLIVYSQNYMRETITMMSFPKQLSELKLSYIFLDVNKELKKCGYFRDYSAFRKIYELNKIDITNLNNFIKCFNEAKKEIREIMFKATDSYYEGMVEARTSNSYLNLWTALEILCLKNKKVTEIEVIKRLKAILIGLSKLEDYKIDRLYTLRNNLIHNAEDNITQYDKNLLKVYVEIMFKFFIFNLSKFDRNSISSIFGYLQKNSGRLKSEKKLIDYIIKLREKNAKNNH